MRAQHDPLATAATCPGCAAAPGTYDHEAVRRNRPERFSEQVVASVREIASTGRLVLRDAPRVVYECNPLARKQAQRYLVEIGAEPRPAKRGRAA